MRGVLGKLAVSEKVPVEMAPSPAGAVVAMDLGFTRFDGFRVEGFGGAGGTNGDQSRSAAERERERVDPWEWCALDPVRPMLAAVRKYSLGLCCAWSEKRYSLYERG